MRIFEVDILCFTRTLNLLDRHDIVMMKLRTRFKHICSY